VTVAFGMQVAVSLASLVSVWLAGSGKFTAWPILIVAHLVFLIYSGFTNQLGFWILNVGMIGIGGRNYLLALKPRKEERSE
jgi:hypothetical protein